MGDEAHALVAEVHVELMGRLADEDLRLDELVRIENPVDRMIGETDDGIVGLTGLNRLLEFGARAVVSVLKLIDNRGAVSHYPQ
jgi:hypothetical protein